MSCSSFHSLGLFFIISLLFVACEEQKIESCNPSIKVLFLGNSFTEDAVSYVPFIINKLQPNIDLTIGVATIGGCSLAQHYCNLNKKTVYLSETEYRPKNYSFYKYEFGSTKWENHGSKDVFEIINDEKWGLITLQQAGAYAAKDWSVYYEPFLSGIVDAIDATVDYPHQWGWVLTHGAYSNRGEGNLAQWKGAMENAKLVLSSSEAEVLFPYGTAIQNLRTTPLCELGDNGDLLADNGHLQEGIGCLTAAYSIAIVLLQQLGFPKETILGDDTHPSFDWNQSVCVIGPHYGKSSTIVGITERNCYISKMAALFSVESPFSIYDCNSLY